MSRKGLGLVVGAIVIALGIGFIAGYLFSRYGESESTLARDWPARIQSPKAADPSDELWRSHVTSRGKKIVSRNKANHPATLKVADSTQSGPEIAFHPGLVIVFPEGKARINRSNEEEVDNITVAYWIEPFGPWTWRYPGGRKKCEATISASGPGIGWEEVLGSHSRRWYPNGDLASEKVPNSTEERAWHPNGKLASENTTDNAGRRILNTWYDTGAVEEAQVSLGDGRVLSHYYFPNGIVSAEGVNNRNGGREGLWIYRHDNGALSSQQHFKDNQPVAEHFVSCYSNGTKCTEGDISASESQLTHWEAWYPNGLKKEEWWMRGRTNRVGESKFWDEAGQLTIKRYEDIEVPPDKGK